MSQRNNPVTLAPELPLAVTHPTQQEIDAYVRAAQRMRAEAVADFLRAFWRFVTGRRHRAAGAPSVTAKA